MLAWCDFSSVQFSSVPQSYPTLCNTRDYSTPGLQVYYHLLKFTQTHVHWVCDAIHWVDDAIQLSHPVSSPSILPSIFPSIRVFSNESALHIRWPKVLEFQLQHQSFQWQISFRMDCLDLLALQGTLKESSPTPRLKSINSWALSFLYSPTLTSIHDYWKNHSFE